MTTSEPIRAPVRSRSPIRTGYWGRWVLGVVSLVVVAQSFLALIVTTYYPLLYPFAFTDAGVSLVVAAVAILLAPAVISVPGETRLRLEEWAALDALPDDHAP